MVQLSLMINLKLNKDYISGSSFKKCTCHNDNCTKRGFVQINSFLRDTPHVKIVSLREWLILIRQ